MWLLLACMQNHRYIGTGNGGSKRPRRDGAVFLIGNANSDCGQRLTPALFGSTICEYSNVECAMKIQVKLNASTLVILTGCCGVIASKTSCAKAKTEFQDILSIYIYLRYTKQHLFIVRILSWSISFIFLVHKTQYFVQSKIRSKNHSRSIRKMIILHF